MKNKMFRKLLFSVVIIVLSFILVSCNLFTPGKKDISEVLTNYADATQKRVDSKLSASVSINFNLIFSEAFDMAFTQIADITRIENNGKYLVSADAYVEDLEGADRLISLLNLFGADALPEAFRDYLLQQKTKGSLLLGYDNNNTYNLKVGFSDKTSPRDFQSYFGFTNQTISSLLESLDFEDTSLTIKDYIMFNDFFGVSESRNYIKNDTAGKRFNSKKDAYLYDFEIDTVLLKNYIVAEIENILTQNANEDFMNDYNTVKDLIIDWVSIEKGNFSAEVNKDNLPKKTYTDFSIKIEIPDGEIKDLIDAIGLEMDNTIKNLLGQIKNFKLSIDIELEDIYSYDAESTKLDEYITKGLFISANEEVEGRIIL